MALTLCTIMQASNMLAAIVVGGSAENNLQRSTTLLKQAGIESAASFEVAFNLACAAISSGQVSAARQLLESAAKKGHETLTAEGASQEVRSRLL
jgi:thioredoxin-like negative regulator of GroEL